jgi:hypothetical protein
MSSNTSGRSAPDGIETARERDSTGLELSSGPGVGDLAPDDLVARAFAILAEETERLHSARSVNLRPASST